MQEREERRSRDGGRLLLCASDSALVGAQPVRIAGPLSPWTEAVAQRCRRFEARGRRWVRRRGRVRGGEGCGRVGAGSGRHGGELVAVNLGEVVGHHQQSPLEAHLGSASSVKAGDAAVVFGVAEERLDGLFAFSIALMAVV